MDYHHMVVMVEREALRMGPLIDQAAKAAARVERKVLRMAARAEREALRTAARVEREALRMGPLIEREALRMGPLIEREALRMGPLIDKPRRRLKTRRVSQCWNEASQTAHAESQRQQVRIEISRRSRPSRLKWRI